MHHRPQRTRTGSPRPALPPVVFAAPSPFADPGIVSLPSSKAVERSQRQGGSGLGSSEEEEKERVRVVFQSLVYVVPRANSAGTSCIELFSHRPTPRDPDKDARSRPAAKRAEGKSKTNREYTVELDQQRRRARASWGERVVRGQARDERDAAVGQTTSYKLFELALCFLVLPSIISHEQSSSPIPKIVP